MSWKSKRPIGLLAALALLVGMTFGWMIPAHAAGAADREGDTEGSGAVLVEAHQGTELDCQGQVTLHFVLNQVTDVQENVTLTAQFTEAGSVTAGTSQTNAATLHFEVSVSGPDTLVTASVEGAGGMLVLSETICLAAAPEEQGETEKQQQTTVETTVDSTVETTAEATVRSEVLVTSPTGAGGTDTSVLGAGLTRPSGVAEQQQTTLPFTGRDAAQLAVLGLIFVIAGLGSMALARRREDIRLRDGS